MNAGHVSLVGAGPGDPELLTLKAARLLGEADVVIFDRLVHPHVLHHARPHARLLYVGKEGGGESAAQEEINALLITHARLGRRVVRLKGGDPFVFGRGAEEALALEAAGITYDVVSGVSSGVAAPAAAGIPVTHRGVSGAVTFATGSRAGREPDWKHLAGSETLVLFMAGPRLADAMVNLVEAGRSPTTPAAVVEAGTWEHQRVVEGTLASIARLAAEQKVTSPALVVVGDVVSIRSQLPTLANVRPELQRAVGG